MTTTEQTSADVSQRRVWRAFVRASALLREALTREVDAGGGMSLNEYEVLERLAEAPDGAVRMAALAEDLVHSRSRLTHAVHRMEARGLVERRACEADGRGVYCALTPGGADAYAAAEPRFRASVEESFFDRLTQEERDVLGRVMGRLADDLAREGALRPAWLAERSG